MQTILNTRLIVERRSELGLSQRALARVLGVRPPAVAALEHGRGHERLTLRLVRLLADALGLDPADLFAQAGAPAREAADDDIKLEAALAQSRHRLDRTALARAFGWDLARTSAALTALAERLRPTGQLLHLNYSAGGYSLRAREGLLTEAEQEAVARARLRRSGLTTRQASLLLDVVDDKPANRWRRAHSGANRADHGRLLNLGLVRLEDGVPVLTEAAAYSLDVQRA